MRTCQPKIPASCSKNKLAALLVETMVATPVFFAAHPGGLNNFFFTAGLKGKSADHLRPACLACASPWPCKQLSTCS